MSLSGTSVDGGLLSWWIVSFHIHIHIHSTNLYWEGVWKRSSTLITLVETLREDPFGALMNSGQDAQATIHALAENIAADIIGLE